MIIPLSIADWGKLIANQHPLYALVSYGMKPCSGIVRQLVTLRLSDGQVFIAETGAQFRDDTNWESDTHLTDMRLAREQITYV